MTGVEVFRSMAPQLVDAAETHDSGLLLLVRQALQGLKHYDLPLGVKIAIEPPFPSTCWVAAFHAELKSPNWFMNDWMRRKNLKQKWARQLWDMVTRVEGVGSRAGLRELGRAPVCHEPMSIQVARLVPRVQHFLRDEDNTAFCTKQLSDALKDVGLIKEDRREWFTAAQLVQDVSPITVPDVDAKGRPVQVGIPVVLFILRPARMAGLLSGVPHAHAQQRPAAPPARPLGHGNDQRGDERHRRPRAGARAIDPSAGQAAGARHRGALLHEGRVDPSGIHPVSVPAAALQADGDHSDGRGLEDGVRRAATSGPVVGDHPEARGTEGRQGREEGEEDRPARRDAAPRARRARQHRGA